MNVVFRVLCLQGETKINLCEMYRGRRMKSYHEIQSGSIIASVCRRDGNLSTHISVKNIKKGTDNLEQKY